MNLLAQLINYAAFAFVLLFAGSGLALLLVALVTTFAGAAP